MHIVELKRMAREAGVPEAHGMYSNTELIRAIQRAQKGSACYLTDERFSCDASNCRWKSSCKKLVAVWAR